MTDTAPAGWYQDPTDPTHEHWWDGTAYTQTRPIDPARLPAATPYPAQPTFAAQPSYPGVAAGVSPKSRLVATLLSFFLGVLGVDRFYLGNIGMGVAKLLVGWLTAGIWPLIDFIIIVAGAAHDGEGRPVTDWDAH